MLPPPAFSCLGLWPFSLLRDAAFRRFIGVGILNTAFNYGLYALLVYCGVMPGAALAASTTLGVIFNYFTTGRLVFGHGSLNRLPRFVLTYTGLWGLNVILLHWVIDAGLNPYLAQFILLVLVVPLTFFLLRRLVFHA